MKRVEKFLNLRPFFIPELFKKTENSTHFCVDAFVLKKQYEANNALYEKNQRKCNCEATNFICTGANKSRSRGKEKSPKTLQAIV